MKSIAPLSYQRFFGPRSRAMSPLPSSPSLKPAVTFTTVLIRLYHLAPNAKIPKSTTITVPTVVRVLASWLLGFLSRAAIGARGSGNGGFGGASASSVGAAATGSACLAMRNPPATGAEVGVVVGAADAPGTTTRIGPGVTRTRAGAAVGAAGAGAAAGAKGEDIERKTS